MLVLAPSVQSFSEIEAACGPGAVLMIFDGIDLPESTTTPNRGDAVWEVAMPRYWPLGARFGVHCRWLPPAGFIGHFRVRCADGHYCAQGTVGNGQALLIEATERGSKLRMNPAFLPPAS